MATAQATYIARHCHVWKSNKASNPVTCSPAIKDLRHTPQTRPPRFAIFNPRPPISLDSYRKSLAPPGGAAIYTELLNRLLESSASKFTPLPPRNLLSTRNGGSKRKNFESPFLIPAILSLHYRKAIRTHLLRDPMTEERKTDTHTHTHSNIDRRPIIQILIFFGASSWSTP